LITRLSAQLFVGDIQASCDFFTKKLGFAVAFVYGDPPFYGQVVRGEARLDLRSEWEPVFVGDVREREHLLSASMNVATGAELAQLFAEFTAAGVAFHQTLKTETWGARTFVVRDPDGNLLLFAGPA
jgi:catechol 2,3-dioxygenase-like lactoylglutathione lyase family enzyme